MNVDKENFGEVLDVVKKAIDEAEFVAVDLELSGVSSSSLYSFLHPLRHFGDTRSSLAFHSPPFIPPLCVPFLHDMIR